MRKKGETKYQNYFKIGDKYGYYTVINNDIILGKEAKIKCECKCGVINLVACYTLIKGTSTKCITCNNIERTMNNNPCWRGYGNIPGKYISKLKRDANLRELDFNINIEYLDKLYLNQSMKCALTGVNLSTSSKNLTASLDRIDSLKGYIEGNVQWVHKDINMMKKHYDEAYFIKMCELVVNHHLLKQ